MSKDKTLEVATVESVSEVSIGDTVVLDAKVVGLYDDYVVLEYQGQGNITFNTPFDPGPLYIVVGHDEYAVVK